MSREIISRQLAPKTVSELTEALAIDCPKPTTDGFRIHPLGNTRLRIDMPIKRLAQYRFEANARQCSWTAAKVRIAVDLRHLSIEQRIEEGMLRVEFRHAPVTNSLALDLAQQATSSVREIFLTRGLRALGGLNALDESILVEATKAPNDFSVLASALGTDESLHSLDPLAGARLRGLDAKRKMLDEEGGTVSASAAAGMLQITRQAIDKRRSEGRLLAVELGKKGYHYPVWQFELGGVDRVLAALSGLDPWQKLTFFLNPNDLLGETTPLDVLRKGTLPVDAVERAAKAYGVHGG